MTDDPKKAEDDLRSRAADAFRYERPAKAQPPAFERFEVTPVESAAVRQEQDDLKEKAKSQFGLTGTP